MTFKVMAAGSADMWEQYLEAMARDRTWIDVAVLHALGCSFRLDVAVHQEGIDPTLVGFSLSHGTGGPLSVPLLSVAVVNDLHFWGLELVRSGPPLPPAGDESLCFAGPRPANPDEHEALYVVPRAASPVCRLALEQRLRSAAGMRAAVTVKPMLCGDLVLRCCVIGSAGPAVQGIQRGSATGRGQGRLAAPAGCA